MKHIISYLVIDLASEKHNVGGVGQRTAERPERALRYPALLKLQVGVGDQDHTHQRKPNRKYLKYFTKMNIVGKKS